MELLLSTYLTKKQDPQRGVAHLPNDPTLIDGWYAGAKKYNAVVFHDELSKPFTDKYPEIKFVKVEKYPYSSNDGRFKLFYDYIKKTKSAEVIFMTDLFDVKVNSIPLDINYDWIYAQQEPRTRGPLKTFWRADWGWARNQFTKCFGDNLGDPNYYKGLIGKSVYNAGVWGGSRDMVLKVCKLMLDKFELYKVGDKNCNMLLFNETLYNDIGEKNIESSIASTFMAYEENSSASFVHK